ncbi:hypothetical protein CK203_044091 [Vitis vinifera]|uniref:Uncharacterized protein n=1 Tax=Vitis vinifera TaxID=29760 RepID=A0A438HM79_VITVI|nr:hypothetical protein CK203_044091 [Vitis vinifera]
MQLLSHEKDCLAPMLLENDGSKTWVEEQRMENSSVTGFLEIIELKVKAAMVSKSVTRLLLLLILKKCIDCKMELAWSTILKNLQVSKMTGGSTRSGTTDEDSEARTAIVLFNATLDMASHAYWISKYIILVGTPPPPESTWHATSIRINSIRAPSQGGHVACQLYPGPSRGHTTLSNIIPGCARPLSSYVDPWDARLQHWHRLWEELFSRRQRCPHLREAARRLGETKTISNGAKPWKGDSWRASDKCRLSSRKQRD